MVLRISWPFKRHNYTRKVVGIGRKQLLQKIMDARIWNISEKKLASSTHRVGEISEPVVNNFFTYCLAFEHYLISLSDDVVEDDTHLFKRNLFTLDLKTSRKHSLGQEYPLSGC